MLLKVHARSMVEGLIVLFVLHGLWGADVQAQAPEKLILALNSYHQGLGWTDDVVAGIRAIFPTERDDVEVWIEYMDTKRVFDDQYFHQLYALYQKKFARYSPDVIIAPDNDALNFLLAYRDDLFPHTPVVFCGINSFSETMLAGHKDFTGVTENPDVKATLDLALQ